MGKPTPLDQWHIDHNKNKANKIKSEANYSPGELSLSTLRQGYEYHRNKGTAATTERAPAPQPAPAATQRQGGRYSPIGSRAYYGARISRDANRQRVVYK
jgi:hypothetical protein